MALIQKRMRSSEVTKGAHFAELLYSDKSISSNLCFLCLPDFGLNDFMTNLFCNSSIFTSSLDPKSYRKVEEMRKFTEPRGRDQPPFAPWRKNTQKEKRKQMFIHLIINSASKIKTAASVSNTRT